MTKTTTTKLQTVNRKLSAAAVEIGQARPGPGAGTGQDEAKSSPKTCYRFEENLM